MDYTINDLVDQFKYNIKDYKSGNFNETNTRQQFIDKFFELLGRDVNNRFGYSEQYKEVVLEDRLKIGGHTKAPDYSFRIGGRRIFFVEAKKPSVNIKEEVEPAYQIRRYSWTAKLPIGILTDFEELAIYDTRIKPIPKDKSGLARIKYLYFEEYEENRERIYNTLSKEAVMKGALDKYIKESKKKGTQSVDTDFLNMIDDRRVALAKNIYLRYGSERKRDLDRLNVIVQDIVDKIIFLRIAEGKQIENLGNLEKIGQGKEIWKNLIKYFAKADKKYNSGLFDNINIFRKFELDDKILKKILLSLYYPVCPYEFSVLGVDILGNIYEKFLGKTIVKHGRSITTEFKPEVKKAGGIFYTPQYIVDYIVKNTIGELLKKKEPKDALKLKIVDPACGSGAFLIGAYNYILDWFVQQHTKDDKITKKSLKDGKIYQYKDGYHLSFAYKKEILRNMIHGVDIDRQAVAVSKLSLLLKLLEGETAETANQLFSTIDAKLLPNLDDNIKCGNSLVDSSIYENLDNINEETIKKINAFDREEEFPEVFEKGGFDVVIGNPPYVKEYTNKESFDLVKKSNLGIFYQGKMDLRYFFVNKGVNILKDSKYLGFIAPNNWITNSGASKLRNDILERVKIKEFIDFGDFKVFDGVGIQTMVFILEKSKNNKKYKVNYSKVVDKNTTHEEITNIFLNKEKSEKFNYFKSEITKEKFIDKNIHFINDEVNEILEKISENDIIYLDKGEVAQGIVAPQDLLNKKNKEKLGYGCNVGEGIFVLTKNELDVLNLSGMEKNIIKPVYTTEEIGRYIANKNNKYRIIYTNSSFKDIFKIKQYPNIKKHLDRFKKVITSDNKPYGLHRARNENFFKGEKILSLRKCQNNPKFSYVSFDSYVQAEFYVIKTDRLDMKYLIGVLNSKLIAFWLKYKGKMQGDNYQIDKEPLLNIPIVKTDEKTKEKMVSLVEQIIEAKKKLSEAEFEDDKKVLQKQIEIIDKKIDKLVFDLYGLSEEESKVVLGREEM